MTFFTKKWERTKKISRLGKKLLDNRRAKPFGTAERERVREWEREREREWERLCALKEKEGQCVAVLGWERIKYVFHSYEKGIKNGHFSRREGALTFIPTPFVPLGNSHSSVDLSAPIILPPRVWVPSTPSKLLSFFVMLKSRK